MEVFAKKSTSYQGLELTLNNFRGSLIAFLGPIVNLIMLIALTHKYWEDNRAGTPTNACC